ncbi:MAG: hypothetical protein ACJ8KX_00700 [Chthoniobacterales bacterium]
MKNSQVGSEQRLTLLRRLDRRHVWGSPDERRLCLGCGRIIRGWEIRIARSIGGIGPLRLRCPSEGCRAGPVEWVLPNELGGMEISADVAVERARVDQVSTG